MFGLTFQTLEALRLKLVFQIFCYLSPTDLLGLYRTNRQLRNILERDSVIWRSCIKAVDGLPDCPPWIPLPYYAALWFDTYCERCKSSRAPTEVLWQCPARYCIDCKYSWCAAMTITTDFLTSKSNLFYSLTVQDPIDSFPEGPYLENYVDNMESVIPVIRCRENSPTLYHSPHILAITHDLERASTDRDRNVIMARRQARLVDCCKVCLLEPHPGNQRYNLCLQLADSYHTWRTSLVKRSHQSAVEVRLNKRKELVHMHISRQAN